MFIYPMFPPAEQLSGEGWVRGGWAGYWRGQAVLAARSLPNRSRHIVYGAATANKRIAAPEVDDPPDLDALLTASSG
jgi:hypothetical protein